MLIKICRNLEYSCFKKRAQFFTILLKTQDKINQTYFQFCFLPIKPMAMFQYERWIEGLWQLYNETKLLYFPG